MKSYLGLVGEYAKVHKKKNRLTVICIAISVMLVTAVFGMADMSVKAQIDGYIKNNGHYHAIANDISLETASRIAGRDDIKVSGWAGWVEDTVYAGRELIVRGGDASMAEQMNLTVLEGTFPQTEREALLDKRGLELFGLDIGDTIEVPIAGETFKYRISGVFGDFIALVGNDAHGLFLNIDGIRAIGSAEYGEAYYIQFGSGVNIRRALQEIREEYGLNDGQLSENTRLLGMMGQSDDSAMWQLYITAGALFVLVTMAGVFMIAGSFNMSVLERTQFFGLLRCLGASKRQIKRYIRLEGLRFCLRGIPLGLIAGCVTTLICALIVNSVGLGDKQPEIPMFQISLLGVGAGVAIGFAVVMLASRSPAKKAAGVSPQAAVTGNLRQTGNLTNGRAATDRFYIDTAMGINHAFSNKKNMLLTAGSFALSIILFMSFSVLIDFMTHAVNPLRPYAPDISVMGADESYIIDGAVVDRLKKLPHIRNIYGRMFMDDVAGRSEYHNGTVTLISYDDTQFMFAGEMLLKGNMRDAGNGKGLLVDHEVASRNQWEPGDVVSLDYNGRQTELPITGILSDTPFHAAEGEWIVICSEAVFTELTGIRDYTIIDMQVNEDIAAQVRGVIPADMLLLDKQQGNQTARAAYYTLAVFIYGFLFVIALISLINIINIVSSGVSSRMNNYGVMRAVGMSGRQLKKIITAEAATYAITGCVFGGILGLALHRLFFSLTVTANWGTSWSPPFAVLAIVIIVTLLTAFIAVISPAKKIREMSIVDVVNAG